MTPPDKTATAGQSSDEPGKLERRLKREARRAKQRELNVKRAEKMGAARLAAGPQETRRSESGVPRFNVGCSGWFYWHWRGAFYPATTPTSQWFSHYADRFKTVELNAPFYAWPTEGTVKTWIKQAGRRKFIYTVKVCELITHVQRFKGTGAMVRDFGHIATLLGPRMGCFLFQLPPSFHYTPGRLRNILDQLDPAHRNVVEFRHRSWWKRPVFDAFRKAGVIFCSCSGPRLPDELVTTADEVYVRFHGTSKWYRHNYTSQELTVWADRIRDSGAKRVWAYFNNDRDGHAIRNARALLQLLKARG